jgi:hypothetical protein
MPFVPVTAQPCPEPDTKVNLTYKFISVPLKSCYGGYYQGALVNYSCTDNPNMEPHKTLRCSSGRRWIETDTTPWPTCNTPPATTEQPDSSTSNSISGKMSFKILHLIREYKGQVF